MKFSEEVDHGSGFDPQNEGHHRGLHSVLKVNNRKGGFTRGGEE